MADDNSQNNSQNNDQTNTQQEGQTQNQPLPATQQTAQTHTTQSDNQRTSQPPFIRELSDSINALPERIANAVAASLPQLNAPQQAEPAKTDSDSAAKGTQRDTDSDKPPTDKAVPPGKQSFTEWWTGVPAGTHRGNG